MSDLIVPQEEMKRLISSILDTFNSQFGRQGDSAIEFEDVETEWVKPREGYQNAILISTEEENDTLTFRVNLKYQLNPIVNISPFRLEVSENADNGPESKVFVAMAEVPVRTFPVSAKLVWSEALAVVQWASGDEDFPDIENGETISLVLTRDITEGTLTVNVSVTLGNNPAVEYTPEFEDGEANVTLIVTIPTSGIEYSAVITADDAYEIGTPSTKTGSVDPGV